MLVLLKTKAAMLNEPDYNWNGKVFSSIYKNEERCWHFFSGAKSIWGKQERIERGNRLSDFSCTRDDIYGGWIQKEMI